ncbi:hypothetical protein [Streptomyces rameus]
MAVRLFASRFGIFLSACGELVERWTGLLKEAGRAHRGSGV